MAQILNLRSPLQTLNASSLKTSSSSSSCSPCSSQLRFSTSFNRNQNIKWTSLQVKLNYRSRFSCFFSSNNRKEDQARKALEGALGGKKMEFEKWNKEIQKREEIGGGDDGGGGGGWFGFGGSNDDHFWQEAQQAGLAILGIILMYLVIAKGEVMLAVVFNPLLYALRGTRNGFTYITSRVLGKIYRGSSVDASDNVPKESVYAQLSAKESVIGKWGSD
ncbi:hypothetical protein MKW98_010715 [Papaver atlanticum]|uniref:Uncharacterized protein n=1 Tax=Papaver atlanticum TaxID=357466 RepID=A0AAD4SGI3_9MAGN|nr:hypothetical protein MKW98_010715 [Papaver atlanticum]